MRQPESVASSYMPKGVEMDGVQWRALPGFLDARLIVARGWVRTVGGRCSRVVKTRV